MEAGRIYRIIGLMSGTSLDGLDICAADFWQEDDAWKFKIIAAETQNYPNYWEESLKNCRNFSAEKLLELHSDYGFFLGESVKKFIENQQITNIFGIASHGHTVFHQPDKKFTLQIGDGRAISIKTGLTTVYDFRNQDVLLGGNGAPLVPFGDKFLFSEYEACLNLGGFSNISFDYLGERIAFDISPVNIVLNFFAKNLGKNYDDGGNFARAGKVDDKVLNQLNSISFYAKNPPKSLGAEFVDSEIFPILKNIPPKDALATFTEHTAQKIAEILNLYSLKTVLISGGGAYNSYLIEKIQVKTSTRIIIPEKNIVEYKEALIFGFLGLMKILGKDNILATATGAKYNHSSGIISYQSLRA